MIIDCNKHPDEMKCHRDGTKHRLCKALRGTCSLWIRLPRKVRLTGEDVEEYHCGDVWQVILAAEANREMVGLHAAMNSFRNEMCKRSDGVLQQAAEMALLHQVLPPPDPDRMEVISDDRNNRSE
mgnify:CR=1 FL=1